MEQLERLGKLDSRPALAICIVPDEVFDNCRPNSTASRTKRSDEGRSKDEAAFLKKAITSRDGGQGGLFVDEAPHVAAVLEGMDAFEEARRYSPDFR